MISGLILYSEIDIERNQWFIDKCLGELNNELFSLMLVNENNVLDIISKQKIDFIINRSRNYQLIAQLEKMGIVCFNGSFTNEIANNKSKSFSLFKENNIVCIESFDSIDKISEYPFVMKSIDGHGGKEVYLIRHEKEAKEILKMSHKKYIYQKYVENSGDLRIYVLGEKVVGAVLRQNIHDFRSNYSLGGSIIKYEPSDTLKEISVRISKLLKADFIGVDFLITKQGFLANEIEDPVGSRMLYQTSDIDVISDFISLIKAKMISK